MQKILEAAKGNLLFQGIPFSDFEQVLGFLSAKTAKYKKGDIIVLSGSAVTFVGLILTGSVQVIKGDDTR